MKKRLLRSKMRSALAIGASNCIKYQILEACRRPQRAIAPFCRASRTRTLALFRSPTEACSRLHHLVRHDVGEGYGRRLAPDLLRQGFGLPLEEKYFDKLFVFDSNACAFFNADGLLRIAPVHPEWAFGPLHGREHEGNAGYVIDVRLRDDDELAVFLADAALLGAL